MSTPSEQTLALLTRIAVAVEKLAGNGKPTGGAAFDAADLDSKWGDPIVKKDPKRWTGQSEAGRPMSQCSPEYLDCCASFYDWQAENAQPWNDKTAEQIAGYRRKDAARARGWAARKRAGWKHPGEVADPIDGYGDNEAEAEAAASANDEAW